MNIQIKGNLIFHLLFFSTVKILYNNFPIILYYLLCITTVWELIIGRIKSLKNHINTIRKL